MPLLYGANYTIIFSSKQECTFLYHTNQKETKVGEMTKSEAKKLHCTVEAAIAVIGGKYKAIIIWWLNEKGVMRYSEIQRRVPQATAKMLSQQLREMEADGIISRKVYPVVPPKTEYALTDLGRATVPVVHAMDKWGADFFNRLGVPIPCDEE